jgi:hypothetical protein
MRHVMLNGKRWRFEYAKLTSKDGDCDPPTAANKTIRIDRNLRRYPAAHLEALIHEGLHACCPDMAENAVDAIARDLSRLVYRELMDGKTT